MITDCESRNRSDGYLLTGWLQTFFLSLSDNSLNLIVFIVF